MKEKIKNIPKQWIYFGGVGIFIFVLIIFSFSYALFSMKVEKSGVLNIVAGDFSYQLTGEGLLSDQITANAQESKIIDITITAKNDRTTAYEMYYNLVSPEALPAGVEIGYLENTPDPVKGEAMNATGTKSVKLIIKNESATSVTIKVGVQGGFQGKALNVTKGTSLNQAVALGTVSTYAFQESKIGAGCSINNDGTETFLKGTCSQNYVRYSGKLWRIVAKNNETNTVKMITEESLTFIPYIEKGTTVQFANSSIDQWLQEEFFPTLDHREQLLVTDFSWNANPYVCIDDRPINTVQVTRAVGLLNYYEYNQVTVQNGESYLSSQYRWWLINPSAKTLAECSDLNDQNYALLVEGSGYLGSWHFADGGVRPTIVVKQGAMIASGTGTKTDPYLLKEGQKKYTNGSTLVNTRSSGEYVLFHDQKYRIIREENSLTKIVAAQVDASFGKISFDATSVLYSNSNIKNTLETYYQSLPSQWKNMVEPNTEWYLGTVNMGENYKKAVCSTPTVGTGTKECQKVSTKATANIGLLRVGELFAIASSGEEFWTLTPYLDTSLRCETDPSSMMENLCISDPTGLLDVKPSLYLKSTVKISSSNTGNGSYEKPFTLE